MSGGYDRHAEVSIEQSMSDIALGKPEFRKKHASVFGRPLFASKTALRNLCGWVVDVDRQHRS